jgi:phosphoribosylformylglycinamidine synthase
VLCESGLLPGAVLRNQHLHFVCDFVSLRVEHATAPFFSRTEEGQVLRIPIKHGEGAYFVAPDELERMKANGQIAVRYCDERGEITDDANPNGALENIAGVRNERGNVMGLMPHPEHAVEPAIGGTDGLSILGSLVDAVRAGGLSR